MKTATIQLFVLLFFSTLFVSCNSEDDTSGSSPSLVYGGYALDEEGASLTFTFPDGTVEDYSDVSIIGWDGGQLLNQHYWKGFRVIVNDNGSSENSLYFRWNLLSDMEWREEMQGDNALNNQRFRLEWSSELSGEWVEMYRPNGNDPITLAATGNVEIRLDEPTTGGEYDLIGVVDGEFNINGQYTTVQGAFWKKEM